MASNTHILPTSHSLCCTVEITGKIKQRYVSVCGHNSIALRSEKSNIFYFAQDSNCFPLGETFIHLKEEEFVKAMLPCLR